MTMQKAAEKAAELANAERGGGTAWVAQNFLGSYASDPERAFVQFIADVDAAARKAQELIVDYVGPKIADGQIAADFLSPFILPDDVDPLLIEARGIVANSETTRTANQTRAIHEGRAAERQVAVALAALRRGIEIAEIFK